MDYFWYRANWGWWGLDVRISDPHAELLRKIKTVLTAAYAHHGRLTAAEAVVLKLALDAERGVVALMA